MTKKLLFIVAAAVTIAIIAAWFARRGSDNLFGGRGSPPAPHVQPGIVVRYPEGDRFEIGTPSGIVAVKNFYITAQDIIDQTEVVLEETSDYTILYSAPSSQFNVVFNSADDLNFLVRSAEDRLLVLLDVSRDDACKLKIAVHVPFAKQNQLPPGGSRSLSFCPPYANIKP